MLEMAPLAALSDTGSLVAYAVALFGPRAPASISET
jgi:hypothetical protein